MTTAFNLIATAEAVVTHADGTTDADDATLDTAEQATDDGAEG